MWRFCATIVAVKKAMSITQPVCNLTPDIQHAMRMRHIVICCLPHPTLYNTSPHYLINGTIFEKKKCLNIKCVFRFSLQLLSEKFLVLRRTEKDMIKVCIGLHVKQKLLLSYFNET
jgi:hypothetical protein